MTSSTVIMPSDAGDTLQVLADKIRVIVSAKDTAAKYELFELQGPEGSGPPPHCHPWDEAYYMLDGGTGH
jgi:hypothetical protein